MYFWREIQLGIIFIYNQWELYWKFGWWKEEKSSSVFLRNRQQYFQIVSDNPRYRLSKTHHENYTKTIIF